MSDIYVVTEKSGFWCVMFGHSVFALYDDFDEASRRADILNKEYDKFKRSFNYGS